MKIAFIVSEFPSVSETFILRQMTTLINRGHEVLIFAGARSRNRVIHPEVTKYDLMAKTHFYLEKPSNILTRLAMALSIFPVFFLRAPLALFCSLNVFRYGLEALSLNYFFQAWAFLAARKCPAVIAHFGPNGLVAERMQGMAALKGKIYVFFHGYDMTSFVKRNKAGIYKRLFAICTKAFAVSHYTRIKLVEMGCPEEKTDVLRMGIAPERYPYFQRILRPGQAVRMLSVARHVEKKGLNYGIEATEILVRKGLPVQYVIIGDGPLRTEYETLADEKSLYGRVLFLGWRDAEAVRHEMEAADIYLLPSVVAQNADEEGIPVALMEALAMGLVVIATDTGGVRELIRHGETGELVLQRDPEAMAAAVEAVLKDSERTRSMSQKGRRLVEEEYDIARLTDKLLSEIAQKR